MTDSDRERPAAVLGGWPETPDEALRGSAVRGTALLVARSLALQGLAFGATLILARLLTPAEYGAFAVAVIVQQAGRGLVEVGLPAGLIQQREPPPPAQQHAVTGFTVALASVVSATAAIVAWVALPALGIESEVAELTAITCLSLPLLSLQVIPSVLLERDLRFGRILAIEASGAVAFYSFALAMAAAGHGAFSLAGAVPVSALVALAVATAVRPWDRGISLDLSPIRHLASFGGQTGAAYLTGILRDLGLVGILAAIGGQALAGFYDMARRLLGLPTAIMYALLRVAFPTLSRTPEAERAGLAARGAGVATLAAGLPLALVAGADGLVEFLFGDRWAPAAEIVAVAAAGMLLYISVGTMLNRLLLAGGDARSPLVAELAHAAVTVVAALVIAPQHGPLAAGLAIGVGYAVNAAVLARFASGVARACAGPVLRGIAIAAVAAVAGHLAGEAVEDQLRLVTSLLAIAAIWSVGAVLIARDQALELSALIRRHIFSGR